MANPTINFHGKSVATALPSTPDPESVFYPKAKGKEAQPVLRSARPHGGNNVHSRISFRPFNRTTSHDGI
jgi:hypothetical protein